MSSSPAHCQVRGAEAWANGFAWVAVPAAGAVWVLAHLSATYYFYDEWSLITRLVDSPRPLATSFENFNGHLNFASFWVYWVNLHVFGLNGHTFVYVVFTFSLVAMHVSLAWFLRAAKVPTLLALIGAGLVVYFGVGSQSMVFEFQMSWNLAYAAVFAAAAVVLCQAPTRSASAVVVALLGLGLLCDSAIATLGILFVGILLLTKWPKLMAGVTLVPPSVAAIWWDVAVGSGPTGREPLTSEAHVGWGLLTNAAAGFGGRDGLGLAIVATGTAVVIVGLVRGRLDRPFLSLTGAAAATVTASILTVTLTRASIIGTDIASYNRYLQTVGVYILVALLPSLWHMLNPRSTSPVWYALGVVALLGMFAANLGPLNAYRKAFDGYNAQTKVLLRESTAIISAGCGPGQTLVLSDRPLGAVGPQVTVLLLKELIDHHDLTSPLGRRVPPGSQALLSSICAGK